MFLHAFLYVDIWDMYGTDQASPEAQTSGLQVSKNCQKY